MSDAERVADILAFEFMKRGNFTAAAGPINPSELFPNSIGAAAMVEDEAGAFSDNTDGFANLEVQSVGYEEKCNPWAMKKELRNLRSTSI